MKNEILFRGTLREALRPHLENLRKRKTELPVRNFEMLLETVRNEFGRHPSRYLTGIRDDDPTRMLIESTFDEILEE